MYILGIITQWALLVSCVVFFSAVVLFVMSLFTKDEIARHKYKRLMIIGAVAIFVGIILWVVVGWLSTDLGGNPIVVPSKDIPIVY